MAAKKQAKKRGGRRRLDPESVANWHLGFRFPDAMRDKVLAIVENANGQLRAQGLPEKMTAYALVRMWIEQRLEEEYARLPSSARKSAYEHLKKPSV